METCKIQWAYVSGTVGPHRRVRGYRGTTRHGEYNILTGHGVFPDKHYVYFVDANRRKWRQIEATHSLSDAKRTVVKHCTNLSK